MKRLRDRLVTAFGGRWQHLEELRQLRQAPWTSSEQMDQLRLERLRWSVARASATSPYYRELFEGLAPHVGSFDDLRRFPVTSKADVVASGRPRAVPGSPLRPRTAWRTSGSSGEPFIFDVDLGYGARHDAQRAFVYLRAGVERGAPIVEVLGFGDHLTGPSQVSYPTFRRTVVGYGRSDIAKVATAVGPSLLYGNRSRLLAIADEVAGWDQRPTVGHVCSSSETLHPQDRDRLGEVFGAPVHEVYGSAEASNLAYRLGGESEWTVLEPRVIVEVLDAAHQPVGVGERGEIVVTTLREPTSPLVRYATGDLATVGAGSGDGRSGLRLRSLDGRTVDAVVSTEGDAVGFSDIAYSDFWASGEMSLHVRRWQVHQEADRSLLVSLELNEGARLGGIAPSIEQHLRSRLGPLPVRVRAVEQLHDPSGGKFRAVTSVASATAACEGFGGSE